jgi:hypothetical protein
LAHPSTVPGQALFLYNSPFVIEQAGCFAQLVMSETGDRAERIRLAYRRALNREPAEEELQQAMKFVQSTTSELNSEEKAWASLCQALLVTSEFRYID